MKIALFYKKGTFGRKKGTFGGQNGTFGRKRRMAYLYIFVVKYQDIRTIEWVLDETGR
jgi:hypothetical protein